MVLAIGAQEPQSTSRPISTLRSTSITSFHLPIAARLSVTCQQHYGTSIVNKTPLSARTNRRIGGNAPSQYVPRLVQDLDSADRLDQLIRTHHADPVLLASDAFEPFIQQRARSMITLIEEATGRTVGGGTVEDVFSVGSARQAGEELDGDQN